ncbi:MAG: oxygenase MpaB family protein [Alphaproteobacteria bacterium]
MADLANMKKGQTYLGWKVDFTTPKGEPSFASPDSISWRVFKNPVALGIGGIAAVLLEFADARIRSGVWDHSTFKTDPVGRAKRTGTAAMVGVYGPQSAARRVIQGVNNMHKRVVGHTPDGEAYDAQDVELLDWVNATAIWGFMVAYDRFVSPLSEAEKDQYFAEGHAVSALYGVETPLNSVADFEAMMANLAPRFEPHAINTEFLEIMASGKAAPGAPVWPQKAVVHAAVAILPPHVRAALELGSEYDLTMAQNMALRIGGKLADIVPDLDSPAANAAVRLGLPRSFAWKSAKAQRRILRSSGLKEVVPAE